MRAHDGKIGAGDETPDYARLLELEGLESLLEELEECGWETVLTTSQLPVDLQARLDDKQATSMADLRDRIARLHATMDNEDDLD
jgi:NTP pyrophosphatase (non-canonical NTP hydrolase)